MNGESEVNLSLPPGLGCLLETSGVYKKYPEVRFFPAYVPGEPDVLGAGLSKLVRFRLFNPAASVVFLSFHDKEVLRTKDRFGVLEVPGTVYLQLPCIKEDLIKTAESIGKWEGNESKEQWKPFAEKACKALISERIKLLKHGQKNAIGNILNPLRASCVGFLDTQHSQNQYLNEANTCIRYLRDFLEIPQIKDLMQWNTVCKEPDDQYLKQAFSFSVNLMKLSCCAINTENDVNNLITLIDTTYIIYNKL